MTSAGGERSGVHVWPCTGPGTASTVSATTPVSSSVQVSRWELGFILIPPPRDPLLLALTRASTYLHQRPAPAAGPPRQGRARDQPPSTPAGRYQYDRGAEACHDGFVMREGRSGGGGGEALRSAV